MEGNLTSFKKGEIHNPTGTNSRKRAFAYIRELYAILGFAKPPTPSELRWWYDNIMLTAPMMTRQQIDEVMARKDTPVAMVGVLKGLLSKRGLDAMLSIYRRIYGGEQQHTDITSDGKQIVLNVTDEQRKLIEAMKV